MKNSRFYASTLAAGNVLQRQQDARASGTPSLTAGQKRAADAQRQHDEFLIKLQDSGTKKQKAEASVIAPLVKAQASGDPAQMEAANAQMLRFATAGNSVAQRLAVQQAVDELRRQNSNTFGLGVFDSIDRMFSSQLSAGNVDVTSFKDLDIGNDGGITYNDPNSKGRRKIGDLNQIEDRNLRAVVEQMLRGGGSSFE
jgi:hypothetical protein